MPAPIVAVLFPVNDAHRALLEASAPGMNLWFKPLEHFPTLAFRNIRAVLGNPSERMLPRLTGLELLQLNSAGVPPFYVAEGALPAGAQLCNASGAYGPGIAEHMLGMALALKKRLHQYRDAQRAGEWVDRGEVSSILGSKTLVVGFGDIGREFGWRMHALGSTVTGIKRTPGERPDWLAELATLDRLDEFLPEADIVFASLPETPATRGLFDRERIGRMKKGAIFLNAGRGSAADTEALCDAVESGALAGAGLDVTDPEPLPKKHRVYGVENILLTPHVSGGYHLPYTHDRIVEICAENLRRWLAGEPLAHVVNRQEGY